MSAVEEYRTWWDETEGWTRNEGMQKAHAAIAALEVERDALYERRLPCREAEVAQKRYEDAEAELAERDRMLDEWWKWSTTDRHIGPSMSRAAWLARLRVLAKEGGDT